MREANYPPSPTDFEEGNERDEEESDDDADQAGREPARIANLRKRLQRIRNTKQKLMRGRQPDPRQLSALQHEADIVSEIDQWEKFGIAAARHTGPKQRTPTQLEQIPYYSSPPEGSPPIPGCPPPHTPVEIEVSHGLAYRKVDEKEPTRIVNLRRRLQRILSTKEKIAQTENGQPDNRQLAALAAEAEIVWEIQQWEAFRVIYPNKPEQRWLPPNSLANHAKEESDSRLALDNAVTATIVAQVPPLMPEPQQPQWQHQHQQPVSSQPIPFPTTPIPAPAPVPLPQAVVAAHNAHEHVREPTRIHNLRRRLQRIQQTKQKLAEGWGSQPDERQWEALQAEAEIVWEIQQWEKHGILVQKMRRDGQPESTSPPQPIGGRQAQHLPYPAHQVPEVGTPPSSHGQGLTNGLNGNALSITDKMFKIQDSTPVKQIARRAREPAISPGATDESTGEAAGTETTRAHVEVWRMGVSEARHAEKLHKLHDVVPTTNPVTTTTTTTNNNAVLRRSASSDSLHSFISVEPPPSPQCPTPSMRRSSLDCIMSPTLSPLKPRSIFQLQQPIPDSPATTIRKKGGQLLSHKYYFDDAMSNQRVHPGFMHEAHQLQHPQVVDPVGVARMPQRNQVVEPPVMRHDDEDDVAVLLQHAIIGDIVEVVTPPRERPSGGEDFDSQFAVGSIAEFDVTDAPLPALQTQAAHLLESSWTIWFDETAARGITQEQYESSIIQLGTFNTIQGFWTYWNNLRVEYLRDNCNLRLFRTGIKPTWEDAHNSCGGKWVARNLTKNKRNQWWLAIVLNMIGELIEDNSVETVTGVVLSTRDGGDAIQLWTDGGYHTRNIADYTAHASQEFRESRPSMQEMLSQIYENDPAIRFAYHSQKGIPIPPPPPISAQKRLGQPVWGMGGDVGASGMGNDIFAFDMTGGLGMGIGGERPQPHYAQPTPPQRAAGFPPHYQPSAAVAIPGPIAPPSMFGAGLPHNPWLKHTSPFVLEGSPGLPPHESPQPHSETFLSFLNTPPAPSPFPQRT